MFNSVTTFDKWFNAPFESYKVASKEDLALKEEEQLYLISRLHSALEPFMLRYDPARSRSRPLPWTLSDGGWPRSRRRTRHGPGASRRTSPPSFLKRSKR